jgi:hypothetical protein
VLQREHPRRALSPPAQARERASAPASAYTPPRAAPPLCRRHVPRPLAGDAGHHLAPVVDADRACLGTVRQCHQKNRSASGQQSMN